MAAMLDMGGRNLQKLDKTTERLMNTVMEQIGTASTDAVSRVAPAMENAIYRVIAERWEQPAPTIFTGEVNVFDAKGS